jgi:Domain of unknown function (DUF4158)/Tn3 transposase DDE domain
VRQHRGDHNRLGIAVQICSLRYPGRVLDENERPPDRLLNLVATQLGISIVAWDVYAQRDETRREHLLELLPRLGMEQFGIKHYREISAWLESTALHVTDLLLEVNRWTSFTRYFVHLKTGEQAKDPTLLLTAILADATNMGLAKMAESSPGTSLSKLSWLVA